MCFSLTASVTAGTALVAAGAVTTALARDRAERPLALLPLLFGVQQLVEGSVWWSLDHHDAGLDATSTVVYMLFSHVLWPVLVPFAVLCLETVPWRRRVVTAALAVGAVVALDGLWRVLRGPAAAYVCGRSLRYELPGPTVVALYLLATCVGALVSSRSFVRLMGAAALVLGLLTLWLYLSVFVSVWCFCCAVLTLMITGYVVRLRRAPPPVVDGLRRPEASRRR